MKYRNGVQALTEVVEEMFQSKARLLLAKP